jgi:hypothetical protein
VTNGVECNYKKLKTKLVSSSGAAFPCGYNSFLRTLYDALILLVIAGPLLLNERFV